MGVNQPQLAVFRPYIGVSQAYPAGAERLYLGAGKGDASLDNILDEVVVIGLAVGSYCLY
jgi:hypothetical protein